MSRKFLVCVVSLVILGFIGTVYAQDLCDKYHDKYRICVEKRDAGRNMNKDACWTLTKSGSSACNGAGCYWDADKGMCLIDICLGDTDLDGYVVGGDSSQVDRDYGRDNCPTTPSLPYPEPITCEGTLSTLGRWCDQGDGTVKDMTTGLVWLQDAGWGGIKVWADCSTWDDAHTRAGTLYDGMSGEPAGLSDGSVEGDWRLPTKSELVGITVGDEYIRSSQMYFFTNVQSYDYWSSTTYANVPSVAWVVNMYGGTKGMDNKYNTLFDDYVWPVRRDND